MNTCDNSGSPQFFIVGAQRSGTTLLRLMLNRHSAVAIPEEAGFLMPYLARRRLLAPDLLSASQKTTFVRYLQRNSQFVKWKLAEKYVERLMGLEIDLRQAIGYLYTSFADQNGKRICGDKSPSFIRKLNLLSEGYPQARFVHIVRDGRDTYLSLKKRNHYSASSAVLASVE
jgi:hypothetical protein